MVKQTDFPIDFVVTWVDGGDPKWIGKKSQYSLSMDNALNGDERFRDFDVFEYWFKNVEKFAPWVNRIFLITDEQLPSFIDKYEKIKIIDHKNYIPEIFLPTFNSNVIENFINKIPDLSEHFVLFNDDMFLTAPTLPTDFFSLDGLPVEVGVMGIVQPSENFQKISFNNNVLLNHFFSKKEILKKNWTKYFSFKYGKKIIQSALTLPYWTITGWHEPHLPEPYLKSTWDLVQNKVPSLSEIGTHRFRSDADTNHWLYKNWQLSSGTFKPRRIHGFGQFIRISEDTNWYKVQKTLQRKQYKITVINDLPMSSSQFEKSKITIKKMFEKIYDGQ